MQQGLYKELPIVMSKLRVIWNLCPSYGKTEPFTLLLNRISNDVMSACTQLPHLFNAVLDAPRVCAQHLQVCAGVVRLIGNRDIAVHSAGLWEGNVKPT